MGHFNIKTILACKQKKMVIIISPLDDLWKKEAINW
jgi:hypothetical protein